MSYSSFPFAQAFTMMRKMLPQAKAVRLASHAVTRGLASQQRLFRRNRRDLPLSKRCAMRNRTRLRFRLSIPWRPAWVMFFVVPLLAISLPYNHFSGYCRDSRRRDVKADSAPAGAASLHSCQQVCNASPACTAIEWYPGTSGYRNVKCHVFPGTPGSGGSSSSPVTQGGGSYKDAQCYIRVPQPPPMPPPPPLPSPPSPPLPPPSPPDYTGTIVGISFGAIALILLIGVSCYIVAKRTAPMRAAWARKAALRKPLTACGLTRHLQQAGIGDDDQVLERAAAWVRANKPASVEDIIQFGMAQGFVDTLNLPPIPKQKLLATFAGRPQQAMPVAMQQAVPVAMPVTTEAIHEGTTTYVMETELPPTRSCFFGSAGASSSSSTQPTLNEAVEILKRELGLQGNMRDVVHQAATQLGVDASLPLLELARRCVQQL